MESKHNKFMTKCFGKGSWQGTQEDMFYHALINLVKNGLTDEGVPALSGAYLNSYQRLMGILVQEVGTRSTPASEMVLKSFLAWEREIRKELTEPAWKVCMCGGVAGLSSRSCKRLTFFLFSRGRFSR